MNQPTHQQGLAAVPQQPDPDQTADATAARLGAALAAHGIALPSLRGYAFNGIPMTELGGCRAEIADAIAAVLEQAAQR
jgi:hypothetical protein